MDTTHNSVGQMQSFMRNNFGVKISSAPPAGP